MRYFILPQLALILGLLASGCAPNPALLNQSASCESLSPAESCSTENSGGELSVSIPNPRSGEEYIVIIQSMEFSNEERPRPTRFRMTSNILSRDLPQEEFEVLQELQMQQRETYRPQMNESISLPTSLSPQTSQSIDHHFYIPHVDDYHMESHGDRIRRSIRTDANPQLKGKIEELAPLYKTEGLYETHIHPAYAGQSRKFTENQACLDEVLGKIFDILGAPLQLDPKKELEILMSDLQGGIGETIGLFNKLDRFRFYQGKEIPDSNYGEILYISPNILSSKFCSTIAHELQHLLNFDFKILRRIPEKDREHIESVAEHKLKEELDGPNEGFSYAFEILTGKTQEVFPLIIRPALRDFHLNTFNLIAANTSARENLASRGLNTLFILHALQRAGGSYDWNDLSTQKFLKELILQPQIGFQNFADFFKEKDLKSFESFHSSLVQSLYEGSLQTNFVPRPRWSKDEVFQGFEILPRDADFSETLSRPNSLHPAEINIPLISKAQSWPLRSDGVSIFRLIVPETLNAQNKDSWTLHISGAESRYALFVIRAR